MESESAEQRHIYIVNYRFAHHALATGYDRLADYVGESLEASPLIKALGESWLRIPAKVMASCSGVRLYGRRDVVTEGFVHFHMARHHNAIYHVIYGEKSFRYLRAPQGRGHSLMATFHNPPSQYPDLFRNMGHLRRLNYATVVSTHQVEFMEQWVGKGRVAYVPYGVDVEYFTPDAQFRSPERPLRCFFGGYHWRDFQNLPAIVERVLSASPSCEFWLVCDNDICKRLAAHPRVRWFAKLPDDEYRDAIRKSDVVVVPLQKSTAVGTVLEALACGVPVITNRGGVEDYLTPECGFVLPVGDTDGMVDTTVALLTDSRRRQTMGQAARRQALRFAWTEVAKQMSDVYKRLN